MLPEIDTTVPHSALTRVFAALELVAPGVSPTPRWRPDVGRVPDAEEVYSHCAVGHTR